MLPTDVFRARFDQLTASLLAWTGFIADVAKVETSDSGAMWCFQLTPKVAHACPVELLLRRDQSFDIAIGPETYEDLPLDDWDLFQPLLEAIVDGRVTTRCRRSAATAAFHSIETVVDLPDGRSWRRNRKGPLAASIQLADTIADDRSYVPYRR